MPSKQNKDEFIEKAKKVHGDKYNYSKVEYVNSTTKVCIICKEHGEFWQTPASHIAKRGCPKCRGGKISKSLSASKDEFKEKAKKVHGDKYDYSKVEYTNNKKKVCIICPKHGEFWQTPDNHINRHQDCPRCKGEKLSKMNTKSWEVVLDEMQKKHIGKYEYDGSTYINSHEKIRIICPKHGEFWQTPNMHLSGRGCPKCSIEFSNRKKLSNTKEFTEKARKIHRCKYDYSNVRYVNNSEKVCIICPKHGEFWQTPNTHLSGKGCPKCANKNITIDEFIEKARKVHGDKYDYSKVEYINSTTKVCIVCPIHGEFLQTPNSHLSGCGCPRCNESHLEREVESNFKEIEHIRQYKTDWLQLQSLDFYLPQYNVAIECQGKQHFGLGWGKKLDFNSEIKDRDIRKKQLCEEHGLKIYYFSHENFDNFLGEKLYHDIDELISEITKNEKKGELYTC